MDTQITIGKVIVKITGTGAGLDLVIKPLTIPMRRALTVQAEKLYPYPDPKPYERSRAAVGAIPAFGGDDTLSAEDNPDYRKACADVDAQRALWLTDAAIEACVACDSKDVLIKAYTPDLEAIKSIGLDTYRVLPWANILFHFLCAESRDGVSEWVVMLQTVNNTMPLTEGETRDGMLFFRLDLQRYVRNLFVGNPRPPRPAQSEQSEVLDTDGRDDRRQELGDEIRPDIDDGGQLANATARNAGATDRALSIGTAD